jgi:hypothetical protein
MVSSYRSSLFKKVSQALYPIVTATGYTYYQGFAHLASGLCCGLSSLVIDVLTYRLLVLLLVLLVMLVSGHLDNKKRSSLV